MLMYLIFGAVIDLERVIPYFIVFYERPHLFIHSAGNGIWE